MRSPFDPNDPAEQLADLTRVKLAEAFAAIIETSAYQKLDAQAQVSSTLAGSLTAVCGIAICQMQANDDGHAEIRAWLAAYLPQAFDQARAIMEFPPLPEANQ